MTQPYFLGGPWSQVTVLEADEFPTVVHLSTDHPMGDLASLFDPTFGALFPALGAQGLQPVGPAFALYHRVPTDTLDVELGIPVDRPMGAEGLMHADVPLTPSVLPAGRIAVVSYLGPYDDLDEAWGLFLDALTDAGHHPTLPFWEFYVTEPTPDTDPASLRTDLVTRLSPGRATR